MREFPYLRHLTNLSSVVIKKYSKEDEFHNERNPIPYDPDEQYLIDSFLSLGEIEIILEQLNQSPYFLSNFRQTQSLKNQGINRFHHIIYHIESHLFRTTGLLDRLLIHVNKVLRIGLNPVDCKPYLMLINKEKPGKYYSIIKNRSSNLATQLLKILDSINKLRIQRNLISHQERYRGEHLKYVEMYYIVSDSNILNNWNQEKYKYYLKLETDKAEKQSKEQMLLFNKEITIQLDSIYNNLESIWKDEYNKLQTYNNK